MYKPAKGSMMKVLIPEEIAAAVGMLLPSLVCANYLIASNTKVATTIMAMGCVIHCPFSVCLHIHRAFSTDAVTRARIFKLDASFIHIHSLLSGYAWSMRPQYIELLLHAACIFHIILSDPLNKPKTKNTIDILCGIGVVKSSFGLAFRSLILYGAAIVQWVILFTIHKKKLAGAHSAWIMHVMLAGPQLCLLYGIEAHDPRWNFF